MLAINLCLSAETSGCLRSHSSFSFLNFHFTYSPTHVIWYCCCCCVTSVVSDSVRPHRRRPTRLPCPWDSPDKNTGVGCYFLFQCMKVKNESEVVQSCPTLSDPMDCSLLGPSVHGICQARVLGWVAIAFSEFGTKLFLIWYFFMSKFCFPLEILVSLA